MALKTNGDYICKRGKWFHYQRRTPKKFNEHFKQNHIQIALDTDSEIEAKARAKEFTRFLDDYLADIAVNGDDTDQKKYNIGLKTLRMCGFKYKTSTEIVTSKDKQDFINRINSAVKAPGVDNKKAITGLIKKPDLLIGNSLEAVIEHEKLKLAKKTPDEVRKWKNPRIKAISNFVAVCGDIAVENIDRSDTLEFRRWWTDRIIHEELTANSANKDFGYVKKAMRIASDNNMLDMPIEDLFKEINLKEGVKKERHPFPTDYIENTLFQHKYKCESEELRLFIFVMADTGCRVSELTGLDALGGDIILDTDIPYIKIRTNKYRGLKTAPSKRDIPLVGSALYAFEELARINKSVGGGFKEYLGRADGLSATLNKYMVENNLRYGENTTLYSLRHSFEDRLQAVEPPEKVHCSVFGHKYDRQRYGDGPSLEQKKKWMDKIAFKV
ncbi:MAG: hypothetical protein COA45_03910 [Zetaproteobacteria bacterium]|nr:MAG: hypothetical protein COA45_03910 [Zetaproteobacteria bacterium]